jgi:hypothetical protein
MTGMTQMMVTWYHLTHVILGIKRSFYRRIIPYETWCVVTQAIVRERFFGTFKKNNPFNSLLALCSMSE